MARGAQQKTTAVKSVHSRNLPNLAMIQKTAQAILDKHKEWLTQECSGWPAESCFDTCCTIGNELCEALPELRIRERNGWFYDPGWEEWMRGHVWLQAKDGTIIDPTAGQFFGGEPLRVFAANAPEQHLYSLKKKDGELPAGVIAPKIPF